MPLVQFIVFQFNLKRTRIRSLNLAAFFSYLKQELIICSGRNSSTRYRYAKTPENDPKPPSAKFTSFLASHALLFRGSAASLEIKKKTHTGTFGEGSLLGGRACCGDRRTTEEYVEAFCFILVFLAKKVELLADLNIEHR